MAKQCCNSHQYHYPYLSLQWGIIMVMMMTLIRRIVQITVIITNIKK